ncbi:hypothetical protein Cni_G22166 [Canna indica]|uniref:Reverse transcriptase domain-containing protein n=1 Tax=Canna indica TaxID=4628 RepID=A0AAQ3QLE6_9LILI|nr:hypothetical protein Cni_G22166 [Canna indica]
MEEFHEKEVLPEKWGRGKIVTVVRKSKRRVPYVIIKMDLEKTYDRVSCEALDKVWERTNMPRKLRTLGEELL